MIKNIELEINNYKLEKNAKRFILNFKNNLNLKQKKINLGNITLYNRDNLHITLIGNTQCLELYEFLNEKYSLQEIENIYFKIEEIINNLLKKQNFELKQEYHLLKKYYIKENIEETRHSIIQIVESNILEKMWQEIKKLCNFKLSYIPPIPHITIYKQKENVGIGLNRYEDLEKLSQKKSNNLSELTL